MIKKGGRMKNFKMYILGIFVIVFFLVGVIGVKAAKLKVVGDKIYNDHYFNSIQDFITQETLQIFEFKTDSK